MVPLYGLVLAGGESKRMGTDKGKLRWHGKEQRLWMADLLRHFCTEVFISCRAEQVGEIDMHRYKTIKDEYTTAGPLGAIFSAFNKAQDVAWLVIACDLPYLDAPAIQYLVAHRDRNSIATAYTSPENRLPEPLVAIWEPIADEFLRSAFTQKMFSPRQILIQQNARCISPANPNTLTNVNYPEENEKVTGSLKSLNSSS